MRKKVTTWYIEPMNASTNETAMANLAEYCDATPDKIHKNKKDVQGKPHDVIEVDHRFIATMERDTAKFSHYFRVFTQKEGEAAMKLWIFGEQKKLHRTKEVKRIKKILQKRKDNVL
jgi:hypothetical protein